MQKERNEMAVVRAKIKRNTFAALNHYCRKENISISGYIRSLIESNVEGVIPLNQAGKTLLEYNKKEDTFSLFIQFDNGPKVQVAEYLQPDFLEQLVSSGGSALELRNTYHKRKNPDSVTIPMNLKKLAGD